MTQFRIFTVIFSAVLIVNALPGISNAYSDIVTDPRGDVSIYSWLDDYFYDGTAPIDIKAVYAEYRVSGSPTLDVLVDYHRLTVWGWDLASIEIDTNGNNVVDYRIQIVRGGAASLYIGSQGRRTICPATHLARYSERIMVFRVRSKCFGNPEYVRVRAVTFTRIETESSASCCYDSWLDQSRWTPYIQRG